MTITISASKMFGQITPTQDEAINSDMIRCGLANLRQTAFIGARIVHTRSSRPGHLPAATVAGPHNAFPRDQPLASVPESATNVSEKSRPKSDPR